MPIYKNLNPSVILPQEIIIETAGDHFYKIGLSQYKIGESQRSSLHNPKLIAIVVSLLLIRCIISLITPKEYEQVFYWMGDFTYYLKIRIHCNVGLISFFSSTLIFLFLHYLKYRKKIRPTYLKPFAMMSGLVPPRAIGLTNQEKIKKMMKNSKIYFSLCNYCMKSTIRLFTLVALLLPFVLYKNIPAIVMLGIPYGILFSLGCYYSFSIYLWQLVYFHTLCYYIKIKLRQIQIEVNLKLDMRKAINDQNIMETIRHLNYVHKEITDFNSNYWYKYLFWNWVLSAFIFSTGLYLSFFGNHSYITRSVILYGTIFVASILIFIIIIASAVALESNKFSALLNSLMTRDKKRNVKIAAKIKVKLVLIFEKNSLNENFFYIKFSNSC
jgi:hypothetical protein